MPRDYSGVTMSAPPTPPGVAGTSAASARKLIALGWSPVDDTGLWSTPDLTEPCPADVALRVAETLAKAKKTLPVAQNWWTHLAGSLPGTAGMGILAGLLAAVVVNPPPTAGLSPTAVTWLQWALPLLATVLLGSQVPKSVKAVAPPSDVTKG